MNIFGHTQVTNQPLSNPTACYSEHIQILLKCLWDFFLSFDLLPDRSTSDSLTHSDLHTRINLCVRICIVYKEPEGPTTGVIPSDFFFKLSCSSGLVFFLLMGVGFKDHLRSFIGRSWQMYELF